MPISSADRPLLRVEKLSVGYSREAVVQDFDLTVDSGEIVSVIGPNGSGKSTLLKGLIGRAKVLGGSVHLEDRDVTGLRGDRLARLGIGFVPQTKDVFATLTVEDNLKMGGYLLSRHELARRIDHVLEIFPALADLRDRSALRLSGGERKMLAVGRVLMLEPKLLLLDEPTAGLSPQRARDLLHEQVPGLAAAGLAVLLVEQKALEALRIASRGYVLVAGRAQIAGAAEDLLARPDIREVFLGSAANAPGR